MPADLGAMFANLLTKSAKGDDADASLEPGATKPEAKTSADKTNPFGQADIDRALLAQLNALAVKPEASANPGKALVKGDGLQPAALRDNAALALLRGEQSAAGGKAPQAADLADLTKDSPKTPSNPTAPNNSAKGDAKATAGDLSKSALLAMFGKPAGAAKPQAKQAQATDSNTAAKSVAKTQAATPDQQLKALNQAAADAKHHTAPAQTTAAKALPIHLADANAGTADQNGKGQSDSHQSQQSPNNATSDSTNLDAASAPKAATQTPASAQVPQQPTHTAAQPAAQAIAAAAPAHPTASTPATTPVVLHIEPQAQAAAQPNLGALAVTVAAKSKNGEKHFDIRLDPPELGRVEVKLSIDDAGKAQANLAVEKPHTLELLQRDRSTLERALRDAGLDLTGGSLNFSLKGQDREQNGGAPQRSRALSVSAIADTDSDIRIPNHHLAAADSRLDIRV